MSLLVIGNINTAFSSLEGLYDMVQDAWVPPLTHDVGGNSAGDVSTDLEFALYSLDVSIDIAVSYSIRFPLENNLESIYGIDVSTDLEFALYSLDVSIDREIVYSIGHVRKDLEAVYSLRHWIHTDFESKYELRKFNAFVPLEGRYSIDVATDLSAVYSLRPLLTYDIEVPYNIYDASYSEREILYSILDTNTVYADLRAVYTIYDPTSETIATTASLTIDGTTVNIDNMTLSHDEDSYCWSLSATLGTLADWVLCEPGKTAVVLIGTDTYNFIIDSRDKDTAFEDDSYTIVGRSPSSVYGEGSLPIYKTWELIAAYAALDELIPTGITKHILDWNILATRLTSEGDTAISLANQIVEAAGGILYSESEGLLVAQYKHKVPPSLYDINDVDYSVSDLDDIFQLNQSRVAKPGYTQVEVSDEPDSDSTQISITEYERNERTYTSILRVDIYPFVASIDLLTSKTGVVITPSTTPIDEQLTEVIEIVNGQGSVSKPILSLDSYTYKDVSLGVLTFAGSEIIPEIGGTTLVEITYTTQYHLVTVNVNAPEQAQVYTWED